MTVGKSPVDPPHPAGQLWKIVGGVALLVGLAVGVLQLADRVSPPPTPVPTITPTGGTTGSEPAVFTGDISDHAGATEFMAFAQEHDGELVDLDLSCVDDFETASCFAEPFEDAVLIWAFTNDRCFIDSSQDADLENCSGANVLWVGDRTGTSVSVANGPSGAGSIVLKGPVHIREQGYGGGVFPVSVRSWDLTPEG